MKTKLFAVMALLVTQAAFASTTYQCNVLSDPEGHDVMGAPAYAIEINGSAVTLLVTTGADEGQPLKTQEYSMKQTVQSVENASYEAEGVTANIGFTMGKEFVGIEADHASASCQAE